jgi:hypothetical protein
MKLFSSAGFIVAAAAMLGLLLAASPASAACDSETALFEDDFEFLDGSWAQPTEQIYVEDGVLVLKDWGQVNLQTWSVAADVCVDATIVEAPDPDVSPVQLIFWWEDWENYHRLLYWAHGYLEVRRLVKGKELSIYSSPDVTAALKQGTGETNQIELQLRPKEIKVFVNGTQVTRLKAKPPKEGGAIGFSAWGSEGKPMVATFDDLVVSEPAE